MSKINNFKKEFPYVVIIDNKGCSYCEEGKTYTILGPDNYTIGASWKDINEAKKWEIILNDTYKKGGKGGK